MQWAYGIENWMNAFYPLSNPINDSTTFYSFLNMTNNLLSLAPNVDAGSVNDITRIITELMIRIFNSNIQVTTQVQSFIFEFLTDILDESSNGLPGIDVNQVLGSFTNTNYNTTDYGVLTGASNTGADVSLSFSGSRLLIAREFYNRFLAVATPTNGQINMASPKAVIPKAVSASLPTNANYKLTFMRNPSSYINAKSPVIATQVVTLVAAGNGNTTYPFPTGAAPLTVYLPWAYAPYTVNGTYTNSCTVNAYTNGTWRVSSTCSVTNITDANNAVVSCSEFSTLGVSCTGGKASTTVFIKPNNNSNKSNGALITFSSLIFALIGLFLF